MSELTLGEPVVPVELGPLVEFVSLVELVPLVELVETTGGPR